MTLAPPSIGRDTGAWELVERLALVDGIARHPHVLRLGARRPDQRDLADAVHALCATHGRHPGMPDEAYAARAQEDAQDWLAVLSDAFAGERAYLARLTAAVGPLPSTPGQQASEAAISGHRHALEMLARSARRGCATGAIAALTIDWRSIRAVLNAAAKHFGIDIPMDPLPPRAETATVVTALGDDPASERAISFGAQALFAQHRGLWDLLEARAAARS
ncbi:DUF6975 family protein [Sphingomonas bacterium]|uniref:DUF6975 family protein n=1 Tax=Sphingomonas bacterium TaxID=1895847 RepID=UPI001575F744|nr:hypothetical protein [Sphingomonas bacterium]